MNVENTLNNKKIINSLTNNMREYAIFGVFIIVCIALAFAEPAFTSSTNVLNVLRQISITGYIAIGMLMVIITGGIDLSAGVLVGLCAASGAAFAHPGQGAIWGILVGLGIGAFCGAVNGFFVAYLGLPPFIVTLGTKLAISGAALVYTKGHPTTGLSDEFIKIGAGFLLGIPIPVWILLLCIILGTFLLNYTKFGRYVYAIGGNETSARVSGVNVKLNKMLVYILAGTFAALAGVVLAARVNAGSPVAGLNYEMDAITICVIGGTSLMGGTGSVRGVVAGMLLMGVVTNGMTLMNVSSYWQLIVKGSIIVLAVLFDTYSKKR